ncbi:MAG: Ppx/GppA family phosphatase [Planctomycetes bacterium]|nr:Ppx/GppA family phosphatase [Planctomycetota bacterium]
MPTRPCPQTVAAIDLGSNSFNLLVASLAGGQIQTIDRLRERIALAAGVDADGNLTEEVQGRALGFLGRVAQRVKDLPAAGIRAVGTNALRAARNAGAFLERAERALGYPIEVVSGREEARLVYLGVAHGLEPDPGRRLVLHIGGGSTECVIGEQLEPLETDCLEMGCVTWSRRFFPDGRITAGALRRAEIAAGVELQTIERRYRALGWTRCIGSAGTIRAVDDVLHANGWSHDGISAEGLARLRRAVVEAGQVDRLSSLRGLPEDRPDVLAGGLAILIAAFELCGIDRMRVSAGTLREGVIHELWARHRQEDVRHRTVRGLVERWGTDTAQATRVERTALTLLDQAGPGCSAEGETPRVFLSWAARLHEIGLGLSYSGYHKHGAYIAANANMPGFSRQDQALLAALIRTHRRKLDLEAFVGLPPAWIALAPRLSVLLRLAVHLNRSRSARQLPPSFSLRAAWPHLELGLPPGWLDGHPLTRADLEEESAFLGAVGVELLLVEAGP